MHNCYKKKENKRVRYFRIPQIPPASSWQRHAIRFQRTKSFQSPYALTYGDLLKWTPSQADSSVLLAGFCWVPNSVAPPNSGTPSVMTLQARPLHLAAPRTEAYRSPSSPEEGPPRMNSSETAADPNCDINLLVTYRSINEGIPLLINFLFHTHGSLEGWPFGDDCASGFSPDAGPPGEDFFPRLGDLTSGSPEAVLFSLRREGSLVPSSSVAPSGEVLAPLSPPSPPSMGATSNILTSTGSSAVSGRGAGHLISLDCATHSCKE